MEKSKHESEDRYKKASENFKQVTKHLQSQIESERNLAVETNKVMRKMENTLRDTVYNYESSQDLVKVLQEDLKKTKLELHRCKRQLAEAVS
jgi:hypothetical protein